MKVKIPEEEIRVTARKILTCKQYRAYRLNGRASDDDKELAYDVADDTIDGIRYQRLNYSDGTTIYYHGTKLLFVRYADAYIVYTTVHADETTSELVTHLTGKSEEQRIRDIECGISAVIMYEYC